MAESDVLMSELLEKTFKCCTKKVVKIMVCVNCGSVYHKSCIERRNYKVIDEVRIMCCQEIKSDLDKNNGKAYYDEITLRYEQEVHYLKQIIIEKNEKYNILMQSNQLLNDKVKYLEEKQKQAADIKKKTTAQTITIQGKSSQINNETKTTNPENLSSQPVNSINKKTNIQPNNKNVENTVQYQSDKSSTTTGILEKVQEQVMREVINLANTNETVGNGWQTVQNKRRTLPRRHIGQFKESTGKFTGLKPKVWMFLYRVMSNVEETDIENYLKERTGQENEEFLVKYIRSTRNNFKCFKVAADLKFKDDFYSPTFWPQGVGYRRFDFRRDELQIQHEENGMQPPSSFLGLTKV